MRLFTRLVILELSLAAILEVEIHDPERMRLIIQIIVVFEILMSCIRRSTEICFL